MSNCSQMNDISLMISQHWFRQLLGAVRQQTITRVNDYYVAIWCYQATMSYSVLNAVVPNGPAICTKQFYDKCLTVVFFIEVTQNCFIPSSGSMVGN